MPGPVPTRRPGRTPVPPRAAVSAGLLAGAVSRAAGRGRGGTLPGRVALRLRPALLAELAGSRTLLLVSGTNGKTTTTRYLTAALRTQGPVVTNGDGANLRAGLATTLMLTRVRTDSPVVLEVDERALAASAGELQPRVVVLLNLSRDQLDRTGEVSGHVRGWAEALREVPRAVVVANADDPLVCAAVLAARPRGRGVRWVAAGQPWQRDSPLCPVCGEPWPRADGDWACASCGFARPAAAWGTSSGVLHTPYGRTVPLELGLPGRANEANAAMAAAAADCLDVPPEAAVEALSQVRDVDGRYLRAQHHGTPVCLLLGKNPAGWGEVLAQLDEQAAPDSPVVVAVNARDADGTDTSWLWDVPFERLAGRPVVAAGERATDVSLRLLYAGVEHTRDDDALAVCRRLPDRTVFVVANYTAFTGVRTRLLREQPPSVALPLAA